MPIPNKIYLYRITHIDNLDFILQSKKLTCPNHSDSDTDYIGIGDKTLIDSRNLSQIYVVPKGNFTDYVSFYFGARSPMLYSIQKGFNNVTKRAPESIIYIVTTFDKIKESGVQYVFTDGHGYHSMSQFFNQEADLKEVDWEAVKLIRWNDTEEDPDKKRRKQAEFLVYKELPISSIAGFAVYDEATKTKVLSKFVANDFSTKVIVQPKWYY